MPDPETAPKVKRLFELALKKGMTIRKLVPLAADIGLKSRNGKPLGASSLHAVLKNHVYAGMITVRDVAAPSIHKALISVEVFKQVQQCLAIRCRRAHEEKKERFNLISMKTCYPVGQIDLTA